MINTELLFSLLDSMKDPLVYVDNDHIIRYMNKTAVERFSKWGDITGRSIFDCHNEHSKEVILEVYEAFKQGDEERMITDNEKRRAYMRAVRDKDGRLLGYFERYEPPVK